MKPFNVISLQLLKTYPSPLRFQGSVLISFIALDVYQLFMIILSALASSLVSVLGGIPYSNTLYGRDSYGQLIKFDSKDISYTLLSDSMFQDVKSKDNFVEAKSYNRTKLLQIDKLKDEFVINGKKYGSKCFEYFQKRRRGYNKLLDLESARYVKHQRLARSSQAIQQLYKYLPLL